MEKIHLSFLGYVIIKKKKKGNFKIQTPPPPPLTKIKYENFPVRLKQEEELLQHIKSN
jgi:hypothetical protein